MERERERGVEKERVMRYELYEAACRVCSETEYKDNDETT